MGLSRLREAEGTDSKDKDARTALDSEKGTDIGNTRNPVTVRRHVATVLVLEVERDERTLYGDDVGE